MKKLKEPSTWAGFGVLCNLLRPFVPPQYHFIIEGVTVLAGGLAVTLTERGAPHVVGK